MTELLSPFGLSVTLPPGTPWSSLDPQQLADWVREHRVVRIRGVTPLPPDQFAHAVRVLGPLQPFRFGAVHELKVDPEPDNYLYTEREVPLHWDGAFLGVIPRWLVFQCVAAPPPGAGGETTFSDTTRVLARASAEQRERWARARFRYTTAKVAHYGGSFSSPVICAHPTLGFTVIRFAEPVFDLNPVNVEQIAGDDCSDLAPALYAPTALLALAWADGDLVLADNHTLLHGRRPFDIAAPRHIFRVNVLDPVRPWWAPIRDSWRIRRPEYMRAEIPILGIPALLSASSISELWRLPAIEGTALFFLLFQLGDLVNCLLDREVDLHRKTHLAEAVTALGSTNVRIQIAISAALAMVLGLHLALTLDRLWLVGAAVIGVVLAASYTAPPLRLKSRGLWQLVAYVGLLFLGPMAIIAGIFAPLPSVPLLLVALTFGLQQTGILLINSAEDLDEDEREGIRTAAVTLGAAGTVRAALGLVVSGGLGLAVVLSTWMGPLGFLTLAAMASTTRWLATLVRSTQGVTETIAREQIRRQGKHVPGFIERGAWVALGVIALGFWIRG